MLTKGSSMISELSIGELSVATQRQRSSRQPIPWKRSESVVMGAHASRARPLHERTGTQNKQDL